MLFQKSTKRFNPGTGTVLTRKKNPCYYDKTKNIVNNSNGNYLKQNIAFCMIPKPRCNSCR